MEIKNSADLRAAIIALEKKKQDQKRQLDIDYRAFTESLKPMNLIKNSINTMKDSPGLTGSLLNAGVGLGAGFLSKKMVLGKSSGLLKRVLGNVIQMVVTGAVANNSGNLQKAGKRLLQKFLRSKRRAQVA